MKWHRREDMIVIKHYQSCGSDLLMQSLPGRTKAAIKLRASKLGVATICKRWTADDDAVIRSLYASFPAAHIAKTLSRSQKKGAVESG